MRKIFCALLLVVVVIVGCCVFVMNRIFHAIDNNTTISVNESDQVYRFYASYDRHQSRKVERYLNKQLNSDVFKNSVIDADMVLDDNSVNIHVKSHPGFLEIKLDKTRNDSAAYQRVKEMGEGIKRRLADDR